MDELIAESTSGSDEDVDDVSRPSGSMVPYVLFIVSLALFFVVPLSIESGKWSSQFTEMLELASEESQSPGGGTLKLIMLCSLMTFAAPFVAHQAYRSKTPRTNPVRWAFAAQALLFAFATFGHGLIMAIATMIIGFGASSSLFDPVFAAILFLDLVAVGWSVLLAARPE